MNAKALKLYPWTFMLMSALPIALFALSLAQELTALKAVLLAAVLAFSIYSGAASARALCQKR